MLALDNDMHPQSTLHRKERKELVRARKAKTNKNFTLIQVSRVTLGCLCEAGAAEQHHPLAPTAHPPPPSHAWLLLQGTVQLWEELRRHDLSAQKRSQLVRSVLERFKGRLAELAGSHTASRVIQACVKFGTAAGT